MTDSYSICSFTILVWGWYFCRSYLYECRKYGYKQSQNMFSNVMKIEECIETTMFFVQKCLDCFHVQVSFPTTLPLPLHPPRWILCRCPACYPMALKKAPRAVRCERRTTTRRRRLVARSSPSRLPCKSENLDASDNHER